MNWNSQFCVKTSTIWRISCIKMLSGFTSKAFENLTFFHHLIEKPKNGIKKKVLTRRIQICLRIINILIDTSIRMIIYWEKIKSCNAYNDIKHFQKVKPFTGDNRWIMRISNDKKHWIIFISSGNFSEWRDHVWDSWEFWVNIYSLWK